MPSWVSRNRRRDGQRLELLVEFLFMFGESEPLFSKGRLDSLAAVNLVMVLEHEFGVDFAHIGLDLEQVESVNLIAQLVRENGGARA